MDDQAAEPCHHYVGGTGPFEKCSGCGWRRWVHVQHGGLGVPSPPPYPPPDLQPDVCGNCRYFEAGRCFADPPRVVWAWGVEQVERVDGAAWGRPHESALAMESVRPDVDYDEPACTVHRWGSEEQREAALQWQKQSVSEEGEE